MLAGVFAALIAGSMGGCKLLKKEKKAFGETCTVDTDCDSLHCSTFGNVCSKTCTYDKDCGGDMVCRGAGEEGAMNLCAKPLGNPPNGGCMTGNDCQHGWCLKKTGEANEPGICSKYCQGADDCPAGMKICATISDSGLLKFCLPGDEKSPPPKFKPAPRAPAGAKVPPLATTTPVATAAATATATAAAASASARTGPTVLKPPPPPTATAAATGAPKKK